jgi:cysteine desulfurase / selenocysteine lyase
MCHVACAVPGVIYLLDACQSVGQLPVDVQKIRCHFLTGTGRKFLRAPRGSGFLYASSEALVDPRIEPSALDVRGGRWTTRDQYTALSSAKRYEEYEMSFAAKVCSLPAFNQVENGRRLCLVHLPLVCCVRIHT